MNDYAFERELRNTVDAQLASENEAINSTLRKTRIYWMVTGVMFTLAMVGLRLSGS
jgi:hypothetical protein